MPDVVDLSQFRLGKQPKVADTRNLKLKAYLSTIPSQPDASPGWANKIITWPMMLNQDLGDCVIAMWGHMVMLWTAWGSTLFTPADADIQAVYSAITGYDPKAALPDGTNPTDQGTDELSANNYMRSTGIDGHKIDVWTEINLGDFNLLKYAVNTFGCVAAGVALPVSAQNQTVWDVVGNPDTDPRSQPGSWGGHGIPVVDYNSTGPIVVTWAALKQTTWAWWGAYCDEAYGPVSVDFISAAGVDPGGLTLEQMISDAELISA